MRLPGLGEAASGGELVRYKPGRRAVFRYPDGKLRADEAGAAHVAVARELIAQDIRTPAPLEYRADLGMAVYEEVHGTRPATLRGGGLEPWMLHAARVPALHEHSRETELADLRRRPRPQPRWAPTRARTRRCCAGAACRSAISSRCGARGSRAASSSRVSGWPAR